MASSLIAGSVSIILILISGYIIATGILVISESGVTTQAEMSSVYESIQQTVIAIDNYTWNDPVLRVDVSNKGSTSFRLSDTGFEIYVGSSTTNRTTRYLKTEFEMNAISDVVNKGFWDPYETVRITKSLGYTPNWFKVVTPNGVTASTVIT